MFTDVIVFINNNNSGFLNAEVEAINGGVTTSCGIIVWNSSVSEQATTCGSELTATSVVITFSLSSTSFNRLCKIGIFGKFCTDLAITISEDAWGGGTTTFDLLDESSKTIALPTLTISPAGCYTSTWTAH